MKPDGIVIFCLWGWQCPSENIGGGDIGRLILKKDFSLSLESSNPFLTTDAIIGPCKLSYPWVFREHDLFHMWYGSTETWDAGNYEMLHIIKYAFSRIRPRLGEDRFCLCRIH